MSQAALGRVNRRGDDAFPHVECCMRCEGAHKKGGDCDRRLLTIVLDGAGSSWEGFLLC